MTKKSKKKPKVTEKIKENRF